MNFIRPAFFRSTRLLYEKGVLGMNRRNISYVSKYNDRRLFPLVDNKLATKKLALEHGVNVPGLIGVIRGQADIKNLESLVAGSSGFCIKPAKGSGGKGILVITDSSVEGYRKPNGDWITLEEINRHASNILAGLFSLGGSVDVAVIESLIVVDESVSQYSYEGVPDIRVIVFQGIPVMAMMRLSCSVSHGKANLHQGAVGVGINIASGKAVSAVQKDRYIEKHPDTEYELMALQIASWDSLLELACSCYEMTGLGYLGVDIVLDKHRGPMLLELNARPGLSIQLANQAGLVPRLRLVESLKRPDRMSTQERIRFAAEKFG